MATGLVALELITGVAFAQTQNNWIGKSSDWFLGSNWSRGHAPEAIESVLIITSSPAPTVVDEPGAVAAQLTVSNNPPSTLPPGSLTIESPGVLNVGALGSVGGGGLTVGSPTGATMTVMGGGLVTDSAGYIALAGGSVGTVTVDGTNSKWTNSPGNVFVGSGSNSTGTLTIENGGAVSDSTGTIANAGGSSGTVTVNNATWTNNSNLFIGRSGTGTLTIENGGLVIAGATLNPVIIANFAGATGTLNIGAAPGSASGPVPPGTLETSQVVFGSGTGTINFNHTSTDYVFTPTITFAPGAPNVGVVNVLAGTTILANNNTYGGGTDVTGGILAAGVPADSPNQAISNALGLGDVSVGGGTLTTPGYLYSVGTLTEAQYNRALTINVAGNYKQDAGGTLELAIGGLDGSQYDHVQVGDSANLAGELVVGPLNGFHPSAANAFEVLHANGTVSGSLSLNDSTFNTTPGVITGHLELRPIEIIAKNAVFLVYVAPPPDEELPTHPAEPEQPPIVDDPGLDVPQPNPDEPISEPEVVKLVDPTAEELTSLYQIGFAAADMQRFNLGDRMFQIQQSVVPPVPVPPPPSGKEVEGKGVEGKAPPPAPPPSPTNRWGVWANSWGDFVNVDSTSAAQGYRFTTFGISAGVDYLIIPNHFAVGLFGGYSHSWINLTQSGSATANTGRGGLYATYFNQGWWVDFAAWGGGTNYSTSRQALAGTANGETSGWEVSTYGEAGYDFHWNDLSFGPTVAMQYTNVHLNGFGENGSLVPLDIHSDSQDSLVTDVGGRAYYKFHVGSIPVIPTVGLAWEHEYFYSNLPITATAPALNGATATFSGPAEGHDSLIINANIAVQWTPRIWTTIGYDGQVARDHYNSNAVTGTFSFSF